MSILICCRSSSPEFKIARTLKSIERDFGLKTDDTPTETQPLAYGHHSDERIKKRVADKYLHSGSVELDSRSLLVCHKNMFNIFFAYTLYRKAVDTLEVVPEVRLEETPEVVQGVMVECCHP